MSKRRRGAFKSGNRRLLPDSRKGGKGGPRASRGRGHSPEHLIEQPIADSVGAVPCQICGHPVDPNRMHFHMVRFHGAAFRPGRP